MNCEPPAAQKERIPLARTETFDREFRADFGYDQPASILASVSMMAAGTGATASKYVARRETPLWIAENCTQCMDCISACPDTALPNTAQERETVLTTAIDGYLHDPDDRSLALAAAPQMETNLREKMGAHVQAKEHEHTFKDLISTEIAAIEGLSEAGSAQLTEVFDRIPFAYSKPNAVFSMIEKKSPGDGGMFSIFVSDLC